MSFPKRNLVGQKFYRWTVIGEAPNKNGRIYWRCQCECGVIRDVLGQNLTNGTAKSCGCLNHELARQRMYKIREDRGLPADGRKGTRLYLAWQNMNRRCSPRDRTGRYFSRNITVCEAWRKFEPFRDWALKHGYSEILTLDRINNDGNYEPSNCRWVDKKIQARNKANNHFVMFRGKMRTIAEIAEITGIKYDKVKHQIYKGLSLDILMNQQKQPVQGCLFLWEQILWLRNRRLKNRQLRKRKR